MSFVRASLLARSALVVRASQGHSWGVVTRQFGAASSSFLDRNSVTERVLSVVKGFDRVEPAKVSATAKFNEDLGLDSLDTVELLMAVEEEFCIEIPDADAEKILSTEEAINYVCSHPNAK